MLRSFLAHFATPQALPHLSSPQPARELGPATPLDLEDTSVIMVPRLLADRVTGLRSLLLERPSAAYTFTCFSTALYLSGVRDTLGHVDRMEQVGDRMPIGRALTIFSGPFAFQFSSFFRDLVDEEFEPNGLRVIHSGIVLGRHRVTSEPIVVEKLGMGELVCRPWSESFRAHIGSKETEFDFATFCPLAGLRHAVSPSMRGT